MGRRCCVAGCPSTSRLIEHHGVTYHSFPLDAVIRAIWIKNSRVSLDRQITKSVLVCSRHFRRLDFHTIRNGKYLLKPRVFPTVFPWGKMEASEIEADHRALQQATIDSAAASAAANSNTSEDVIKASVEAIVAQILAETVERNAAAAAAAAKADEEGAKAALEEAAKVAATGSDDNTSEEPANTSSAATDAATASNTEGSPSLVAPQKYGPPTNIAIGGRLEAKNSEGAWLPARIVEINETDQTLLIRFDRNNKLRAPASANSSSQEWMRMKSDRLRQRISSRVLPVFELEEKCMARWSGPRKFPGTIKKKLGNDTYEVLFDDGYTKNVRAIHMNKLPRQLAAIDGFDIGTSMLSAKRPSDSGGGSGSNKKSKTFLQRKDWPLLDMSALDLTALGLPEIPHDGEWTCHWVNDQPIGTEGFLIVGEHHKPTVIVQDWRLPTGWVKHMYQRSNVLGKWDVILVSPSGKRFRSKSDLKIFLESQDLVYNPDVYDFSIHRRRAKDINAYVYTHDYSPQQPQKPKRQDVSLDSTATLNQSIDKVQAVKSTTSSSQGDAEESQYMETPVASLVPPAELMSPQAHAPEDATSVTMPPTEGNATTTVPTNMEESSGTVVDDFAFIGGLKVQITDNLFVCPREGCGKTYRKEDFLQIHIRHYHKEFAQHVSHCPKMQELAVKRTHPSSMEQAESTPKNQIPNQQFFAKLHQQDLQQSRSVRRQIAPNTPPSSVTTGTSPGQGSPIKLMVSPKMESVNSPTIAMPPVVAVSAPATTTLDTSKVATPASATHNRVTKRSRVSPNQRLSASRKSSRQRMQRRYVNPSHVTPVVAQPMASEEFEESCQSFNNSTPDIRIASGGGGDAKKRRLAAPTTPNSVRSPGMSNVGSTSAEQMDINAALAPPSHTPNHTAQYIKENGELIRIVRMRQEEIINCICEYGEEDGLMIQCELCLCWQHGACNGIVKESDVPEKYVCFICRNPQRMRESMRFKHDQEWLFDGRLPVANYHTANPQNGKTFELLKRSHTLTGNLLDAKRSMHSLQVKINIAKNRCHPKLYLWAKRWDEMHPESSVTPVKRPKTEQPNMPNVPQPEAAIDPEECQYRLIEHVKVQQGLILNRLNDIEAEIDQLEQEDNLPDLKDADISVTKDAIATFIKELEILKRLARLNSVANQKQAQKEQEALPAVPQL